MRAKFIGIAACLMLSACSPPGLVAGGIKPANPDFYKDLPEKFKLKGKVAVGEVTSELKDYGWLANHDTVRPEVYKEALKSILDTGKVLAHGKPKYVLTARIMDKQYTSTGMMHITTGAAVAYRVVEVGSENEVFAKTITSAFEKKKGFLEDANPAMKRATGAAFGENAVQLVRELVNVVPVDPKDPATIPLHRLKGAAK